jgi:hypothetical protein
VSSKPAWWDPVSKNKPNQTMEQQNQPFSFVKKEKNILIYLNHTTIKL